MSLNISPIKSMLDDLSLDLVTIDPDNLIDLGEMLEKIERLAEAVSSQGWEEADLIMVGLRGALEAIILDRTEDKQKVMDLIGQGVSLFQEIVRSLGGGGSFDGDLTAFVSAMKTEADIDLERDPSAPVPESAPVGKTLGPSPPEEPAVYEIDEDKDLFFSFVSESLEHVQEIEIRIISLEQDSGNKEVINDVFRHFHTIKGVSGFLKLQDIHKLTHNVENLLDDARQDRIPIRDEFIDVILDAVDILKRNIDQVRQALETGETLLDDASLPEFLERIKAVRQGDVPAEADRGASPYSGLKLGEILLEQGLISEKELDRILVNQEVSRLCRLGEILVEKNILRPEDLEEALHCQLEAPDGKKIGELLIDTGKVQPAEVSRAIVDQEKQRSKKLGEILILEQQAGAREVASALREQKKTPQGAGGGGRTVKVDTGKLDGLVDMVGELVIAMSLVDSNDRILELKDQKLSRDLSQMARITSDLQRTAMSMRMVPIRQTFQKMIRLVRDLSRKSGKKVDLVMSGEDTEIDRNMVEAIYDPLVHMVRNSIDHGIELPAARREKGKSPEGLIHLWAFHQGGNVVIEIHDDGRGLDVEKILDKAIDRGLASPGDQLGDSAVFNLIFLPGFSTAEKVTDVSGRGVGMDVVKRAIEKLRGKVEVNSQPGRGSTFTIRMPLTLAVIDGMIVRVGQNRYIMPTVSIHESFRPRREDYFTVQGQGEMIKVRKTLLPLIRLDRVLGADGMGLEPTESLAIVVENNGERRCILVDDVLGKQEVVIKSLGERLKHVRALAGGSILGDGMVGLILDVAGLFEVSDGQAGGPPGIIETETAEDWEMDDDWGMGPT